MVSLEFLLTSLVVVLIPGTGVLYTVSTGLFVSRRATLFAALGCTLGIVPSMLASILGLAALFHTSAVAFQLVKYIGVAYLLYLAWSMWRAESALNVDDSPQQSKLWGIAFKGFLLNILNPKLSLFFLAFLPQFVPVQAAQPLLSMFTLGLIFMVMTFAVFVIYGALASSFRRFIVQSETAGQVMQKVFAGSFAALGVKLALTER